ncbi:MAG: hypothetical protein AAGI89_12220 [Pseudomonadota bacterium]
MGFRQVLGFGSVWEKDSGADDACGVFRWRLEVAQRKDKLHADFTPLAGHNGRWSDGWYNFTSTLTEGHVDYPCADSDKMGLRIMIACVSLTEGKPPSISLSTSLSGSSIPGSPSGGSGLSLNYSPGYSGQKLEWLIKLQACPGADGCPDITVLDHQASVSDEEYYWGDEVWPLTSESDSVTDHLPEIGIGACNQRLEHKRTRENRLPINSTPHIESTDRATKGGIA